MNHDTILEDPAFPAMTLDILNNMLSRADNPGQLAKYLTEEIRELTGARCVLLIHCLGTDHKIIDINPTRHRNWAQSPEAQRLYELIHHLPDTQFWHSEEPSEISAILHANGFKLSITVPLRVGPKPVGALLLLGLPDKHHIKTQIKLLSTLSKVLTLVLRNSLLYENQEKAIAERTHELIKSEERFRAVFERSTIGKSLTRTDGKLLKANKAFCDLLGYSSEEMHQLNFTDITHPDDIPTSEACIRCLLANEQDGFRMEKRYIHKNGKIVWTDVSTSLLKDEAGSNCYFMTSISDITHRKQLESRLQQAQKMEAIGTLAGGIAHDFNNILFPILGFSEMLQEDLPKDSPEQKSISEVLHAALRAKELVKQILTFSRQNEPEVKPLKLQSILKEALKLLRSSIPKTIDLQTDVDPDCGVVMADPTQIHQVIMNLATNAYHAMQASGGKLQINLKQTRIESMTLGLFELAPGQYAQLKFTDTGTGIQKNILGKIFDPYFSTKEKGKGTGLGLSIVLGIVKSCNGDIHIYSEPGMGTEINVYLPILENFGKNDRPDPLEPIQKGSERILLVDDEQAIIKMEKQMLDRLGYLVTPMTGSVEALELLKKTPENFDLVISDMTMPHMTGLQLADEIKAIRPDIPIIICTGFSDQINQENFRAMGIQGYVVKPVIKRQMAQTIREVLNVSNQMPPKQ